MADPFATGLDVLFTGPGSVAADYYPDGDLPVPVRAIRVNTQERAPAAFIVGEGICLRRREVPNPQSGEQIVIGAEAFRLDGEARSDLEGLTWTIAIEPDCP